jgi:hypothetical protein
MGEVYRAADINLNVKSRFKVLRAAVAGRSRFFLVQAVKQPGRDVIHVMTAP